MTESFWRIPDREDRASNLGGDIRLFEKLLTYGAELDPLVLGGRFAVRRRLGQGGTGIVLQATDQRRGEDIALKFMHPEWMRHTAGVESFQKEARLAVQLKHAHILRVYDVIEIRGLKALSMELLEGFNLREHMAQVGDEFYKDPLNMYKVLSPLFQALIYAHVYTIHRDIKPENIGVKTSGGIKLMDFGIARMRDMETAGITRSTMTQMHAGTPFYVAPEQLSDPATVGPSADQYALGVIAYELLSGAPPMGVASPLEQLRPELPVPLTRAFDRALAQSPQQRFPDVAAFAEEVERGMNVQCKPVWRTIHSNRGRTHLVRIGLAAAMILVLWLGINLVHQSVQHKGVHLDRLWDELANLEQKLGQSERGLREHVSMANLLSNDFQNALSRVELGLMHPSDWIDLSNRFLVSTQVIARLSHQALSLQALELDHERLRQARRQIMMGDLDSGERVLRGLSETMTIQSNRLRSVQQEAADVIKARGIIEAVKWMKHHGMFKKELDLSLWGGIDLDPNLVAFEDVIDTLEPKALAALETLESQYQAELQRWMHLSKGLDPEALAFIVNVPELARQARAMRANSDLAGSGRHFLSLIQTLKSWNDELNITLDRSNKSWERSTDKIENSIGMRFVRIGTGYLSIWETRVMDFARFIHEKAPGSQVVNKRWKTPGYPLSPVNPVVGISLNDAVNFTSWLRLKFLEHETDPGIPGKLNRNAQNPLADYYREQSVSRAVLIDPDSYKNEWFSENYQDREVRSEYFIKHVGRSQPDAHGVFDLLGNTWEWTLDIHEIPNPPVNYREYPILVGGGPGTVTFQEFEPMDPNLRCILRPEMIGFRVFTSAGPMSN